MFTHRKVDDVYQWLTLFAICKLRILDVTNNEKYFHLFLGGQSYSQECPDS